MELQYEDDFLEGAVFICAGGRRRGIPSLAIARFHAERERLYRILDPDDRNAAFFNLHRTWFQEWGLEDLLARVLAEFPHLADGLKVLAFRKARNRQEEAAELYVNSDTNRHGVVALRCERFGDDDKLHPWLRHELSHLDDMLDPEFGYAPVLEAPGITATQQRLARERYRLLWDLTIDSRLARAGYPVQTPRELHREQFNHAYSFWPDARRFEVFDSLWSNPRPTHAALAALAADPKALDHHHGAFPGAPCPLCGFPTFAWAAREQFDDAMVERIQREFSGWDIAQSACLRCLETYQAAAQAYDYLNAGV